MLSEQVQPPSPHHSKSSSGVCHSSPSHATELPPAFFAVRPSHRELPHGLDAHLLPRHVAIIMDGNSRWADTRGLSCAAGHEAGAKSLKEIVRLSCEWGLAALTVFAFSTENWHRGQVEISILMQLFQNVLTEEVDTLVKENIEVRVIGDTQRFPLPLQSLIHKVQQKTANNTGLKFTVAASYSGRYDIVQACQRVAANVQQGKLNPKDITERHLEDQLGTSWIGDIRNPDLLIRTSGEQRLSNFLLWQLAYTELFFMDVMWPDVDEVHYANALLYFQRRHRRYGRRPGVSAP
ncbi:hypothetical protein GOP47_0008031 [Adiantum capillus-veneris]|uniref:Alkyl transferase n=1 Tax=Adiantum capillus-veneris TaxID=13818 RepID=A0A9D4UY08_ADICA|nr:hypothetical protein GOP47_0008031 [Adiantum capillus-veneris]